MNSWTPPVELGTTIPRRAKMSMGYIIGLTLVPLLLVPVMVLLATVVFSQFEKIKLLQERGVKVTGEVTGKHIVQDKHGKVYHVDYRFNVLDESNANQLGFDVVQDVNYGLLSVGKSVPVVYDPMRFDRSALNIDNSLYLKKPTDTFYLFIVAVSSIVIPLTVVQILLWGGYLKQKRLVEWGTAAAAEIVGEREVRTRSGRVSTLTYQFRDHDGKLIQGERKYAPVRDATHSYFIETRHRIFENPTVLYDPYDSTSNILYPPSSVEVRQ